MRSALLAATLALMINLVPAGHAAEPTAIKVYKTPTCGCCHAWVSYLEDNGFVAEVVDLPDIEDVKDRLGVPRALRSCHTAVVDGYVIEGHVPVADIRRLLEERAALAGLTAPGMPMHSPGMASLEPKGYDVIGYRPDGQTEIYSAY